MVTVTRAAFLGVAALAGTFFTSLPFADAQDSAGQAISEPASSEVLPGDSENANPDDGAAALAPGASASDARGNAPSGVTAEAGAPEKEPLAKKQDQSTDKASIRNTASQDKATPDNTAGTSATSENAASQEEAETLVEPSAPVSENAAAEKNPADEQQSASPVPSELTPSDTDASEAAGPLTSDPAAAEPESLAVTEPDTSAEEQVAEPAAPAIAPEDVTLNIATWSGAYGQSQERVFMAPFRSRTGYTLETIVYDGRYAELEDQKDDPKWSLVDLNAGDMVRACKEGRLERFGAEFLASGADGTPAVEDFLPGAIHPCGIASVAWSAVLVFDNRLEAKPASLKDFFDLGNFPGKRALPKQPRYSLELALMADGVAADRVYETLQTIQGQNRAFAKLSSIKDDIVWWEDPSDVLGRIVKKEAIMGLAFNGRAFMSIVASEQPLDILWDGQIYTYDYWSIPQGAEFQTAAKEFISFATASERLAEQASWLPYGPARRSAASIVGKHPELGIDMKPFVPTYEANFSNALAMDSEFWAEYEQALTARFEEWVEGRQLPPQKSALVSQ